MKVSLRRLPDSEFEVMRSVWQLEPPTTTLQIIANLQANKEWKPQTVLTMLLRLTEKGFLKSERLGRERCYTPTITEGEYLQVETSDFIKRYAGNSIGNLVKALSANSQLSANDAQELRDWLAKRR